MKKTPDALKFLPDDWSEEDKIDYEVYIKEAKKMFDYMDDFVIHTGVIAYINKRRLGDIDEEIDEEKVKECMSKYDNSTLYETPESENFNIEDTLKPIIKVNE